MPNENASAETSEHSTGSAGLLADLIVEEMAAAAGQAERERDLLLAKRLAEFERREAEHQLRLMQLEQTSATGWRRCMTARKETAVKKARKAILSRVRKASRARTANRSKARKATRAKRASAAKKAMRSKATRVIRARKVNRSRATKATAEIPALQDATASTVSTALENAENGANQAATVNPAPQE